MKKQEDLSIKCERILEVKPGFFQEPALSLNLESVDITDLVSELDNKIGTDTILDNLSEDDVVGWLQKQGYEVKL